MSREKNQVPCTSFNLRAPVSLDALVEEMARIELRTKTAILTLALTEYVERHHPELFRQYDGAAA
jgi:predicted transcriptional regulator